MSNDTNGVFDMVHDEKTSKMDPEKWAAINDPRSQHPSRNGGDEGDDRIMISGMPVRRVEPRMSTPGAYRVGDTESYYGGRTVGDDSDDESEFMVVPKAALVDEKDEKDGVMKDIEAPSSKPVPIVKAQRSYPDAMRSTPTKKSTHKRKFRCCMLFCCLLLVLLLGGVLYFLSKDELPALLSSEAAADNEPANGGGNGSGNGGEINNDNDGNDGDNGGDGRGGGGGGGGGGRGNGRGNDND